jgi:hypothetical protein
MNRQIEYESCITYHSKDMKDSKEMANVKSFYRQTNKRMNKQMDRPKTICPQSFNTGA